MRVRIVDDLKRTTSRMRNEVLIRKVCVCRTFDDCGRWTFDADGDGVDECYVDAVNVVCRPKVATRLVFAFDVCYNYREDGWQDTLDFFAYNADRGSVAVTLFAEAETIRNYLVRNFGASVE